jgi:hypothetical protein
MLFTVIIIIIIISCSPIIYSYFRVHFYTSTLVVSLLSKQVFLVLVSLTILMTSTTRPVRCIRMSLLRLLL